MKHRLIHDIKHSFKKNYSLFIFFIVILAFIELIGFNKNFSNYANFTLIEERKYTVEDGTLKGFSQNDGLLISEHNDPNITLSSINMPIQYLTIHCANSNPKAISQVFYRGEYEIFTEENSVTFFLSSSETTIKFPDNAINIESLRLDLTNTPGDALDCQGFTINPRIPYHFSYFRTSVYILIFLVIVFANRIIDPVLAQRLRLGFFKNAIWFFVILLIMIDMVYPVTITFDSAHFLWLADIIKQETWESWDPIRYIGFPLNIFISLSILGYNQNALLIPMILSHIVLFVVSCYFALSLFKPRNENNRFLIFLFIFILIALDPTVIGYYHTLLTEYVVATIAIISCFVALQLYKSTLFSKRFYILSAFFLFMVPVAWFLKQPYIGAAYFPFIIVFFLIILRNFSKKILLYGLVANVVIIIIVLATTVAWNTFVENRGNPMSEERQFSTWAESRVGGTAEYLAAEPLTAIKQLIKQYLASTNVSRLNSNNYLTKMSLTAAFQNKLIAQRGIRNFKESNIFYSRSLAKYTKYFQSFYYPPLWLNNIFGVRIKTSNFLFTTTFLILPIFTVAIFIFWLRRKNIINTALIILGGTSLLNAIAHLFASPIDRYLFFGFPLNLLILTILLIHLFKRFSFSIRKKRNTMHLMNESHKPFS